jgi:predicted amidohydrolase
MNSIRIAAAQLGPIQKSDTRESAVQRLVALLEAAHEHRCQLVVFPELALTTFFPRWYTENQGEIDGYFEDGMPNAATQPLFERAKALGIGFYLGYAERSTQADATHRFNTSILVGPDGKIAGKYRKVHLPGHAEYDPKRKHQHLEKRYFEVGDLGFPVWELFGTRIGMCLCNDRRWPETYRVMALRGAEIVVLGYNTPTNNALVDDEGADLRMFHNHLCMQAGAHQNGLWVVAAAKAGVEDGHPLMGGSAIIDPRGQIVALAESTADELIVAECNLELGRFYRETIFNFAAHRRPEHYGPITAQAGVRIEP